MIGHNNPPLEFHDSTKEMFLAFVVHVLTNKYEKLIGHTIAYFMDEDGNCDISMPDLIKYTGIEDLRTLNKYIKGIEQKKALYTKRQRGKRNQYKLVADSIQYALQKANVDASKTTTSTEKVHTPHATTSDALATPNVHTWDATSADNALTSDAPSSSHAVSSHATTSHKAQTSHATSLEKSLSRADIDNNINKKNKKTNTSYLQKKQKKFDLDLENYDPSSYKTKHQLPDCWRVEEPLRVWARNGSIGASDAQIDFQAEKFRNHHLAHGKAMKNWNKAFQTWMQNAKEYGHLRQKQQFRSDRFYREDGKMRA